MGQLKNADYTVSLLQRIFNYGDDLNESKSVREFLDWFNDQLDPGTGRKYEPIGDRQFYRYIEGDQHLPAYLVLPIARKTLDAKFISYFHVTLPLSDQEALDKRIAEKEAIAKRLLEEVQQLKSSKA